MGNYGCGGGSLRNTLKYLDKTGGLMAYVDYPYAARVLHKFLIFNHLIKAIFIAKKVPIQQTPCHCKHYFMGNIASKG